VPGTRQFIWDWCSFSQRGLTRVYVAKIVWTICPTIELISAWLLPRVPSRAAEGCVEPERSQRIGFFFLYSVVKVRVLGSFVQFEALGSGGLFQIP